MNQSEFEISYQNYDLIFKNSLSIFKDGVIDFLGIDLPEIDSFLETEFAEIETKDEMLDLNFRLKDGSILHLEEEADISRKDLIRFASYDLKLYNRYPDQIRTLILCINGFEDSEAGFNTGSLDYRTTVVDMSTKDGDSKLEEIEQKVKAGEEINILKLIFLPLMDSQKRRVDRVKKAIDLEQKLGLEKAKTSKIIAMTLVLVDKFLEEKEISEIWRDYKMLRIFQHAEEKGEEKGIEKGIEIGKEKGIEIGEEKAKFEMLEKMLLEKFNSIPDEYREKLKKQSNAKLEFIGTKILSMEKIEELEEYL